MSEWILIINYLLTKGVCSNVSFSRWVPVVFEIVGDDVLKHFDIFLSEIQSAWNRNIITLVQYNLLKQYSLWRIDASEAVDQLIAQGVILLLWNDRAFPVALRSIPDHPILLYCAGNVDLLNGPLISIVGTRNPSDWGVEKTIQIVSETVQTGFITVSGAARGIDSVVLEHSQHSGKTIAVLPALSESSVFKQRGQVLFCAEYMTVRPEFEKWKYIARNRVIAALSVATIVIEAPVKSGTLHTVNFATMYDRSVYFLLPSGVGERNYGGVAVANSRSQSEFILSFYDVIWREFTIATLRRYYNRIEAISGGKIRISSHEYRYLGVVDLVKNQYVCQKDVVELERLGIVCQRKGTVLFNFFESKAWQKI